MQKIEDADYLYRRGNRYVVRVQVPTSLQAVMGKGELKKAMGADLAKARRDSHRVIADFQNMLEAARRGMSSSVASDIGPLDEDTVDRAVHAHFRRMAINMRGKSAGRASEDDPPSTSRADRIRGFDEHIEMLLDVIDAGDFGMMSASAEWLCEEHGWAIDPSTDLFRHLCERMTRARLACFRDEASRLRGEYGERRNTDPLFGKTPPTATAKPRTIGDLIETFNRERQDGWSTSTKKNYVIITRVIEEMCGTDRPLATIDKEFCRGIRSALLQLPSNYQKKAATRGRTIDEVIVIAKEQQMPLLQPATVNAHLNKLGAILRFGRDDGWLQGNPMAGVAVDDPVDALEKRDPFRIEQLKVIFSSDPWAGGEPASDDKPSHFWVPLIALFTGARLGEICGLRLDEFHEREGFKVMEIRHRADRPVKGGKSRSIPVHSTLIALGLINFVEERRRAKAVFLFPDEKANKLGHWGDGVSDWFGRNIKRLKLDGRKLTMHSFRHSFEDALREADLHDTPLGNAITGRRSGSVSATYGSKFSTTKLAAAVEAVRYPGLSLNHVKAYGERGGG